MKKRFRLLSILAAAAIGVSLCVSGCGSNETAECEHKWDEGKVTTPSTCYSEGVKTYTCTVEGCGETRTEPVKKAEHSWNDGVETTAPTCIEAGVTTYTCTVQECGAQKTEPIDKVDHSWDEGKITKVPDLLKKGEVTYTCTVEGCGETKQDPLAAQADFSEQFYTDSIVNKNWLYGYAENFDAQADELNFSQITATDEEEPGVWKAEGVEIGNGSVYSLGNAAIAYRFADEIDVDLFVSFAGDEAGTLLNAYLVLANTDGVKDIIELNADGINIWDYSSEEALSVEAGDILYLVFDNIGEGEPSGKLTFTISAKCLHIWDDGVVDEATCTEDGKIVYTCDECGATKEEVIKSQGHSVITDKWLIDGDTHYQECANCEEKQNVDGHDTDGHGYDDEEHWSTCSVCDAEVADTREAHDWDEGEITSKATLTSDGLKTHTCKSDDCDATKSESYEPAKTSTTFAGDFENTLKGENTGWEVGVVAYDFPSETFGFTKITAKNGGGDAFNDNSDGWKEIKGDWMASNGMMGFAYHFYDTASVNVAFNLHCSADGGRYSLRWAIKDKDGNIKNADGKAQWGGGGPEFGHDITFNENITVEDGDVLYLLINKDGDGDQSTFDITLTKAVDNSGSGEENNANVDLAYSKVYKED